MAYGLQPHRLVPLPCAIAPLLRGPLAGQLNCGSNVSGGFNLERASHDEMGFLTNDLLEVHR
jgi:hypothetical protein